jgi:hypothetical protein
MPLDSDSIFKQQKAERERREKFVERERFLNLRHLPARMTIEEVAALFRMSPHDIPVLVANGLLKPLGDPVQSSVKYFARVVLEELSENVDWLHQATAAIQGHWAMKNARRSGDAEYSPLPEKERVSSRHSTAARAPSR